jgi:hypothetical protein
VRASAAFAGSPERHRQAKVGDERLELRDVGQGLGHIDVKYVPEAAGHKDTLKLT